MVFGESALLLKYQIVAGARPRQSNLAHASNGKGLLLAAVCQALHARSYNHGRRLLRSFISVATIFMGSMEPHFPAPGLSTLGVE